jgi:hypothetical protein
MGLDSEFTVVEGGCVCCGDKTRVCNTDWMLRNAEVLAPGEDLPGVCDLCAHALVHAWRREHGQLVIATSPKVARTYFLVPRLLAGRSDTDIASYELLVNPDGGLPSLPLVKPWHHVVWLRDTHGCVTWEPMFRQCYLGYAASGDFSEVLLARAWGRIVTSQRKLRFARFEELLGKPTPDAGFYLGVKAAFEGLLWRREAQPEGNALCTVMREPAMRYLAAQLAGQQEDGEDPAMVEMFRTMMTADELEVARSVVEEQKARAKSTAAGKAPEVAVATDVPGPFDGTEDEGSEEGTSSGEVAEGYARPERKT